MKRMFRGLGSRDVIVFKRTGQFPPSQVPVFSDPEVMEYEGAELEEYSPRDWLNVTLDPENARGYGPTLIWVDASICELTPSGQYGCAPVKAVTAKTQGRVWDFA